MFCFLESEIPLLFLFSGVPEFFGGDAVGEDLRSECEGSSADQAA